MKYKDMGYLLYKCRRCGKIVKNVHVPNITICLVQFTVSGKCTAWPMSGTIYPIGFHHCNNGHVGITDIIGGEYDKENNQ